jgi:hypothetical protein
MDRRLFIKISICLKKCIMNKIRLSYNTRDSVVVYNRLNLCEDTRDEILFLNNIIEIIKKNNPLYSDIEIYIVVLYLYYALVLEEQTQYSLCVSDINRIIEYINDTNIFYTFGRYRISYNNIVKLFFYIAISNEEYCSKIRRLFFNFD